MCYMCNSRNVHDRWLNICDQALRVICTNIRIIVKILNVWLHTDKMYYIQIWNEDVYICTMLDKKTSFYLVTHLFLVLESLK